MTATNMEPRSRSFAPVAFVSLKTNHFRSKWKPRSRLHSTQLLQSSDPSSWQHAVSSSILPSKDSHFFAFSSLLSESDNFGSDAIQNEGTVFTITFLALLLGVVGLYQLMQSRGFVDAEMSPSPTELTDTNKEHDSDIQIETLSERKVEEEIVTQTGTKNDNTGVELDSSTQMAMSSVEELEEEKTEQGASNNEFLSDTIAESESKASDEEINTEEANVPSLQRTDNNTNDVVPKEELQEDFQLSTIMKQKAEAQANAQTQLEEVDSMTSGVLAQKRLADVRNARRYMMEKARDRVLQPQNKDVENTPKQNEVREEGKMEEKENVMLSPMPTRELKKKEGIKYYLKKRSVLIVAIALVAGKRLLSLAINKGMFL